MSYQKRIRDVLAGRGYVGRYEPRHIEGWMRLERGTLDGLDARTFAHEVEMARQCVDASPMRDNDQIADSYGL